jgi:hypothetical protein
MKRLFLPYIVIPIALPIWCITTIGQTVQTKDSGKTLNQCFEMAHKEALAKGYQNGYWIGYSIQRRMEENSFIGSYYSDTKRNHPTLAEIIAGAQLNKIDEPDYDIGDCQTIEGVVTTENDSKPKKKILKEIGILFHFNGTSNKELRDIKISNLSLHVNIENDPLIWLNGFSNEQSMTFLRDRFKNISSAEIQEDIVRAVGLHEASDQTYSFLKEILVNDYKNSLREEATFWLGQQNTDDALTTLMGTAQKDKSEDVREKAIFAISEMENEKATDSLIKLVREADESNIRNKAMFWLSQRASEKAVLVINDIAQNDDDTEVQKQAVFVLTQLSDNESIPSLIKIARTHRNPEVRKSAIFWLGQSEDNRALDAIVEIIKN